ncbi:MAG: pilus assembly protein PilO [Comamonadaceae bacterium]|nr:MAG: pilus assembly protein PilO [Comamonadaceae bacterium]
MKPSPWTHLRFALHRHGWPALLGLLLMALAWPLAHWGADGARAQAEAARMAQAAQREQLARQPDPGADQASRLAEFQRQLPDAAAALEAVQVIHRSAAEHGVALATGEYRLLREGGTRLQRYQITLPADGAYPALRAWMADVLNTLPTIALDELSLSRDAVGATQVEARVRWSFYLRAP